jgi:hypothetical protein
MYGMYQHPTRYQREGGVTVGVEVEGEGVKNTKNLHLML